MPDIGRVLNQKGVCHKAANNIGGCRTVHDPKKEKIKPVISSNSMKQQRTVLYNVRRGSGRLERYRHVYGSYQRYNNMWRVKGGEKDGHVRAIL